MSADFVLTIESDDEGQDASRLKPLNGNERAKIQNASSNASDKLSTAASKDKGKGKGKGKRKRGGDDDDGNDAAMDGRFTFDALGGATFDGFSIGGGSSSSSRKIPGQDWDLDSTIERFRKKNGVPRTSVDDIIARRKGAVTTYRAGTIEEDDAASIVTEDEGDADLESQQGGFDEEDEEESMAELDDQPGSGDEESNGISGALGSDQGGSQSGDESSDDDEDEDKNDYISPFAALANASTSLSDAEDEDLNFMPLEEDEREPSTLKANGIAQSAASYFAKETSSSKSGPRISTNEALSAKSSLPPFSALPGTTLSRPILLGLSSMNLTTPTPVQARTIPVALLGKDIVGSSITGSGKTVAFWVGVLERLLYRDKKQPGTRVVVICPTRELAVQVHGVGVTLARYTDIRFSLCVGGLALKVQEAELRSRPDVLVCTPGRLIDHVKNTASFSLEALEILIIDEADRILEEGFKDELSEIIRSCPHNRQTMLFSATITEDINALARLSLRKPVRISIDVKDSTSRNLQQEFVKIRSEPMRPASLLYLAQNVLTNRCIIFFRSKQGAHWMKILFGLMGLSAEELHGNLTQEQRLTSLKRFKEGQASFLLATDLASRGLDIRGIESVINYDAPKSFEIYLHRVGRTARAGKDGRAVTFISDANNEERKLMKLALKSQLTHQKTKSQPVELHSAGQQQSKSAPIDPSLHFIALDHEAVRDLIERVKELKPEILEIMQEERTEKELRSTEMQVQKGQNMLDHRDEIFAKPKRTWFQSTQEKSRAKERGKDDWNTRVSSGDGGGDGAKKGAKRDKASQPMLNHKQMRRKEALDEMKASKRSNADSKDKPSSYSSSIKAAKKAAMPQAISQLRSPASGGSAGTKKQKGAKGAKKGKGKRK